MTNRPIVPPLLMAAFTELEVTEQAIAATTVTLAAQKRWAEYIGTQVIPEMLDETYLTDGGALEDGREVEFVQGLHVNVTKDNKAAAHEWLEANDLGDIIRPTITLTLPKGQSAPAVTLYHALQLLSAGMPGAEVTIDTAVHGASIRALVKKRLALGEPLPEAIGVYAPWTMKVVA